MALPPSCAAPPASAGYLPSASAGYPPSASAGYPPSAAWPRVAPPLKEEEGGYPAGAAAPLACARGALDTPPVRGGVAADAAELAGGTFRFRPAAVGGVNQRPASADPRPEAAGAGDVNQRTGAGDEADAKAAAQGAGDVSQRTEGTPALPSHEPGALDRDLGNTAISNPNPKPNPDPDPNL